MKKLCVALIFALLLSSAAVADERLPSEMAVSAKSAVMIDGISGRLLFSKNDRARMPMASTTKIMTALITLEQSGLDDIFEPDEAAIKVEGTSMGLKPGDKLTLRTLAYGMLLSSGNDAANAAAVRIAGSIPAFVELMNAKAAALGLSDTHFCTPSGLDAEEHYSTAYDMAILASYALKNPSFADICGAQSAKVYYGNPPYRRTLTNHNRLLKEYSGCIGVKTGFTKKSGRCLVAAAEREGVRLITVTLNASDDWDDHKKLLDYGFSISKVLSLKSAFDKLTIKLVGSAQKQLEAGVFEDVRASLAPEQLASVTTRCYAPAFLYAPLKKGDVVGRVEYLLGESVIAAGSLVALESAEQKQTAPRRGLLGRLFG